MPYLIDHAKFPACTCQPTDFQGIPKHSMECAFNRAVLDYLINEAEGTLTPTVTNPSILPPCSRTRDCGNDGFGAYHGPSCQRAKTLQEQAEAILYGTEDH